MKEGHNEAVEEQGQHRATDDHGHPSFQDQKKKSRNYRNPKSEKLLKKISQEDLSMCLTPSFYGNEAKFIQQKENKHDSP